MTPPYPDEFRLSLTSPSGASFRLEWKEGALEYRAYNEHFDPTRMERLQPTPEAWAKFWQAMDVAGVWEWQARYLNPAEAEGIQWQVALRLEDKAVGAYGDNAFPGESPAARGTVTPSPQFKAFHQGVRELVGGLPFD
ncbi:MAG: hypothetical protein ACRDG5_02335 [Anaerolineales bacterium]